VELKVADQSFAVAIYTDPRRMLKYLMQMEVDDLEWSRFQFVGARALLIDDIKGSHEESTRDI
jgi:hypothetical protein